MRIIYTTHALDVIDAIADFVESRNTPGSGKRFVLKFKSAIEKLAHPNVQYSLCNYPVLAQLQYSCGHYNDWVIAFRIENEGFVVYQIFHSSYLV